MSGATLVVFVGGLAAVFLFIVAVLMWQEARSRRYDDGPTYVIEDAVTHVVDHLDPDVAERLGRADVLRILEWEIFYLQGLAQKRRSQPVETVAGGVEGSIDFIAREIAAKNKVTYDSDDIAAVLELEVQYLTSIGAVGERIGEIQEEDDPS